MRAQTPTGEQEVCPSEGEDHAVFVSMADPDGYPKQLLRDAHFLCSHQRMSIELLDKLVLQLNRTYPQILCDKEAHKFRNLRVPSKVRLAELLRELHCKGEEACHEFYRGLQIHAEDMYRRLPSRVRYRETADPKMTITEAVNPGRYVLSDRGPLFFLSCFSVVVGIAMLYYYGEGVTMRCTAPLLHYSARRLSKDVLISYVEDRKNKTLWS